jgi:hypothetical protein
MDGSYSNFTLEHYYFDKQLVEVVEWSCDL